MAHSDERTLATMLAAMTPAALARVLQRRGLPSSIDWRDCFDAAEALLTPGDIDRALRALSRDRLRDLADAATAADAPHDLPALRGRALVDDDGRVFTAVAEAMGNVDAAATADDDSGAIPPSADAHTSALLAEQGWATLAAITDLVGADIPITTTGAGAVTAADRRRFVEADVATGPRHLDDLIRIAHAAGLVRRLERDWRLTRTGAAWLALSALERWGRLVDGWRAALPEAVRTSAGGYLPLTAWAGRMPLDPDWPALADEQRRRAHLLGLCDEHGAEPPWATPLREGGDADTAPLAALLPHEVDQVYLQADLTAIAPGPLRSDLDQRLRTMAVRESRAQAAGYRFTADSISAAISAGEDAISLRDFLTSLSLTGIPQPLDYLISQADARFGLIRVGTDASAGRTRITGSDGRLLQTIAVDQSLRPLGLVSTEDGTLHTRVGRDSVFWALRDAHYPVVALDDDGRIQPLRRRHPIVDDDGENESDSALLDLAERLIAHSGVGSEAAWLGRELDHAVRDHRQVEVTVRMPDGTPRIFVLEATGLGGGRLRGRDRTADIERTLPLSHIVAVSPL